MEINILFFILKIYSFLWFLIAFFSLPLLIFINKKNKNYLYFLPVLGFSILLLFLKWIFYLDLLNIINNIFYISLLILIFFIFILVKKNKNLLLRYLRISIFNYFVILLLLYFFVFFQGGAILPYIPSYEVNHDPIIILTTAKSFLLKTTSSENIGMMKFLDLSRGNYPISFVLFLYLVSQTVRQDFYNVAHLINIFIYGLTFLPFIKFLEELIYHKNKYVYLFAAIFSIFSYLGIQVVNQSFYNQVMLLPFMISSIYFIINVFKYFKSNNLTLFLSISLIGVILSYSFTGLIWLIILIFLLITFSIKNDFKEIYQNIIFILRSIIITILFILPFIFNDLNLFFSGLFNNASREGSFLKALGNTIGYPSFLVSFNTWSVLDFRINQISKKFLLFSIFFTLSLIFLSFIGYVKSKVISKKNILNLLILILVVSIPPFIFRFFSLSPYYYSKTLFYASFIYSGLIGLGLIISFISFKNLIVKTIIIIILLIYFNNSLRSINYFGRPPLIKFEELKNFSIFFENRNIKMVTLIDNEDWAKYFLFNQGACVAFARTFPCKIGYKEANNGKIILNSDLVNYYLVSNKYKDIIVNLNEAELLRSDNYYSLYFLK